MKEFLGRAVLVVGCLVWGAVGWVRGQVATGVKEQGGTKVAVVEGKWRINGEITHRGSAAEGLLMNVRMVNATFEDRAKPEFDAEANTDRFIARIPEYVEQGVRAFTLCLQGGMPGYEGAVNSAFEADGSLRADYLKRVERVIRACDEQGVAVILGCYYQRQSGILRDEAALRAGVVNVVRWIQGKGWQHVLLEIANEYPHRGFKHMLIRDAKGQASLIRLAKETMPGLLVTASGYGDGLIQREVAEASDFLTPHWNGTKVEEIPARVKALAQFGKPIVCNEDDKTGEAAAQALEASVKSGASYGAMLKERNQTLPFRFEGAADDLVFYARLKALTTRPMAGAQSYFPPPDAKGGWRTLKNAEEIRRMAGMDQGKLDAALAFIQGSTKNGGLLVSRRGWLVYERYFGRGHHEATANLASCGKSFTSVAVGILMAERPELFPDGLDQKVFTPRYFPPEAFPLSDPRKAEITLGQLLAFTAGIRGNNPSYANGKQTTISPPGPDGWSAVVDDYALGQRDVRYQDRDVSARTLWCEPGSGYSYATASIHLASVMLRHVTGEELREYVERHLAKPLGWGRWGYGYRQYAGQGVTHTPGGGGIVVRPTDMLRFGYLLLREGRWNERQVIPAEYVRHCRQASPYNSHFPYSLQFDVNTGGEVAELPRDAFWKSGSGGHVLYVVPSLDLVVWKLGGRDAQYSEGDTGLPVHLEAAKGAAARPDWKEVVDNATALRETLRMVIGAVKD